MDTNEPVIRAVLVAVGARGAGDGRGGGYERLVLEGFTDDETENAVAQLHRAGYLHAWHVKPAINESRPHWEPSTLTASGRRALENLEPR